jgi:antitoxin YefM
MYRLLGSAVQVVSFSEARESFKAVLDRVEADADETLITRRHAKGAVVMSLDTYNSLMETVHLLRSPENAAYLQRSREQADRGELLSHGLIDPDLADAGDCAAGLDGCRLGRLPPVAEPGPQAAAAHQPADPGLPARSLRRHRQTGASAGKHGRLLVTPHR